MKTLKQRLIELDERILDSHFEILFLKKKKFIFNKAKKLIKAENSLAEFLEQKEALTLLTAAAIHGKLSFHDQPLAFPLHNKLLQLGFYLNSRNQEKNGNWHHSYGWE